MKTREHFCKVGLGVAIVLVIVDTAYSSAVLHVPDPYPTIQDAIDAASTHDVVLLANGVYTGVRNRDLDFQGKGITVRSESNDPALCVIDCGGLGRGFYFHNGEDSDARVRGVTITNGRATAATPGGARGGAVYCESAGPTIANCVLSHSEADSSGGGIASYWGEVYIVDCRITDNLAQTGGGIYVDGAQTVTIENTQVVYNNAHLGHGGGIYCKSWRSRSTVILNDCTISYNTLTPTPSAYKGAALHCAASAAVLTHCLIEGNMGGDGVISGSGWGAGLTLTGCTLESNVADGSGGAVMSTQVGYATIADCAFRDNVAMSGGGGALYLYGYADVIRSTLTGNGAPSGRGGAVYCGGGAISRFTHCVLSGNSSAGVGAALYTSPSTDTTLTNCALTDHSGNAAIGSEGEALVITNCTIINTDGGTGLRVSAGNPVIANSIFRNNGVPEIEVVSGNPEVRFCNVEGGFVGVGNIDAEALFLNPLGPDQDPLTWEDNDYRLGPGSPCIDAGDNTSLPADVFDLDVDGDTTEAVPLDLRLESRCVDDPDMIDTGYGTAPLADMGAYEFQGLATFVPGDLNCDGVVNNFDIDAFVLALTDPAGYVAAYPHCGAVLGDVNGDGEVNNFDIDPFVEVLSG